MITGVDLHLIERQPPSRLHTTYGEAPDLRQHVIVELSAEGQKGWGEASPLPEFTGETAEGIARVLKGVYLPALLGRDPREIALLMAGLDRLFPGNPSAKAAIDIALHDLVGRLLGQPVYRLLGGACRPWVQLARTIGITSLPHAVELALEYTQRGFRTLKLKVGTDARSDVARVRAVHEAVGSDVALRIDANGGYDVQTASWVLRQLESCDLLYVEQPLPAWDLPGLRLLRQHVPVRIMADESVHSPADALQLAAERLVDIVAIKLIKTGGLWRARKVAAVAEAAGIACVVISPFETQIGAAAGLHLAVSLEHAPYAHELTVFVTQPTMAETGIRLEGDHLFPAETAGLGVTRIAEFVDLVQR